MESDQYRIVAGVSLVATGLFTILGITTAEALYPGYHTGTQTISALGATGSTPEATLVFNGTMVVAGILVVVATVGLHRAYGRRPLTGVMGATGIGGFVGVGLFPAQMGAPHLVAALIAFAGAGIAALVVAYIHDGPFRYVSAVLGVLELVALVLFMTLSETNPRGVSGLERWVAYLGVAWVIAFGGLVLARESLRGGSAASTSA